MDARMTTGGGENGVLCSALVDLRSALLKTILGFQRQGPLSLPLDYEAFMTRNRGILEKDPHRELYLFPRDDLSIATFESAVQKKATDSNSLLSLFTLDALRCYSSDHHVLSFNYRKFGGDYDWLMSNQSDDLPELNFELDLMDGEDQSDSKQGGSYLLTEGYLMQLPNESSLLENFKSAKKRFCSFRGQTDSEQIHLTLCKDRGGQMPSVFLVEHIAKSSRKGKPVLEVRVQQMVKKSGSSSALLFTMDSDLEADKWLEAVKGTLTTVEKADDSQSTGSGAADSVSISSTDSRGASSNSGDSATTAWRALNRAGCRALQPPTTIRRDPFTLYGDLEPLDVRKPSSSLLEGGEGTQSLPEEKFGVRFVVEFQSFNVRLPLENQAGAKDEYRLEQVEPFFVRAYLFDVKTSERLSEEFELDCNSNELKGLLRSSKNNQNSDDASTVVNGISRLWFARRGTKAIFSVVKPHNDIYLVLRIDRVLQSPPPADLYNRQDPRTSAKFKKTVPQFCAKLSSFRTPFGWAARPVFQDFMGANKDSMSVYRFDATKMTDQDLTKAILDLSKPEKSSKYHPLPGCSVCLKVDLSAKTETMTNRISSLFIPLLPFDGEQSSSPAVTMQHFAPPSVPYKEPVNLLYIYPLSLKYDGQRAFSKARNIALTIYLKSDDSPSTEPLRVIYSTLGEQAFRSEATCTVSHHDSYPTFSNEIKLQLPNALTNKCHLLFAFSHISLSTALNPKQQDAPFISPVGYSWIPLLKEDGSLVLTENENEFALSVCQDLQEKYLDGMCAQSTAVVPSQAMGSMKSSTSFEGRWVDGGRQLFRIRLRLVSSLLCTDQQVQSFFKSVGRSQKVGESSSSELVGEGAAGRSEAEKKTLQEQKWEQAACDVADRARELSLVKPERTFPYLPVILNRLLQTLGSCCYEVEAIGLLSCLVRTVDGWCRLEGGESALRAYIRLQFGVTGGGAAKVFVHEAMCRYTAQLFRPAHADVAMLAALLNHLWFFLDVTTKSMALQLLTAGKHKLLRTERFSSEFLYRIEAFFQAAVPTLIAKQRELQKETQAANVALAYFLRACLTMIDREMVLQMLYFYCDKMDRCDAKAVRNLKLDFLQIISQHEHWLPLCVPAVVSNGVVARIIGETSAIHEVHKHSSTPPIQTSESVGGFLSRFLSSVLGQQMTNGESPIGNNNTKDAELEQELRLSREYCERHFPTGILLQELLSCLQTAQQRIALVYAPLFSIMLNEVSKLESVAKQQPETNTDTDSIFRRPRSVSPYGKRSPAAETSGIVANELLLVDRASHQRNSSATIPTLALQPADRFDKREATNWLLCGLYLLKLLPHSALRLYWRGNTEQLDALLRLFELTLDAFRYQDRAYKKGQSTKNGGGRVVSFVDHGGSSLKVASAIASGQMVAQSPLCPPLSASRSDLGAIGTIRDSHLAQEAAMIVLDSLKLLCDTVKDRLTVETDTNRQFLVRIHHIYLSLLSGAWPEDVRLHTLAALAIMAKNFSTAYFGAVDSPLLPALCRALLEQLASRLVSVQKSSAALLLLLLRASYEAGGRGPSLGRMGVGVAVALARLLGEGAARSLPDCPYFRRGLVKVESITTSQKHTTHFDTLVMTLVDQMKGILRATSALKRAENDPLKLAEIHLRLADSYREIPVLRQTWLETLAQLHVSRDCFTEAALCHLHVAAIIAKSLHANGRIRIDWNLFHTINENLLRDEQLTDIIKTFPKVAASSANVDEYSCSVENWSYRIEECAKLLWKAERYEALGPLFRLVIPFYEQTRNFEALTELYHSLNQGYAKVVDLRLSGKRALASYFRVVFRGQYQQEMCGVDENATTSSQKSAPEFVYKEPGLTSLAEAADRLQLHLANLLGHERIKLIADNHKTESEEPGWLYVHLAHLEPVLNTTTTADRLSPSAVDHYQLHTNLSCFRYETLIVEQTAGANTPDERCQVTRRAKRRVYLTTSKCFPCLLRRLPVVARREETLTPLLVAVEELQTKAAQLTRTLSVIPVDLKRLQLQLQGAVQVQVNAGPLTYAEAFTTDDQLRRYGADGLDMLKQAFTDLVTVCDEALKMNEQLVSSDQTEYHRMLVQGFATLVDKLRAILGDAVVPVGTVWLRNGDADAESPSSGRSTLRAALNETLTESVSSRASVCSSSTLTGGGVDATVSKRTSVHVFDAISGTDVAN